MSKPHDIQAKCASRSGHIRLYLALQESIPTKIGAASHGQVEPCGSIVKGGKGKRPDAEPIPALTHHVTWTLRTCGARQTPMVKAGIEPDAEPTQAMLRDENGLMLNVPPISVGSLSLN
ncbi:hypothetical protein VNO77_19335 [Canavalia gladiata]|uniref:Uncharacterized protein n=1 Tax=Canavalia gladiata TaxID=3824 RepID=A0AAN9LRC7_CANGL